MKIIIPLTTYLEIDIIGERHSTRVNLKDSPFGFLVGKRKLDFTVDSSRTNQRRVQGLDTIGRHDHLCIERV